MRVDADHKWAAVVCLILALLCLFASSADASQEKPRLSFIDVSEVSIGFKQYLPGGHYPFITDNGIPNRALDKGLDLTVNAVILRYLYWDNTIVSLTDQSTVSGRGQFRLVGWNFRFGVLFSQSFRLGYYHFSQHLLDATMPWHFPVEDAIEFRWTIFRSDAPSRGIF